MVQKITKIYFIQTLDKDIQIWIKNHNKILYPIIPRKKGAGYLPRLDGSRPPGYGWFPHPALKRCLFPTQERTIATSCVGNMETI